MLQRLCRASAFLQTPEDAELPSLFAVARHHDGSVYIARCSSDGLRLDVFRISEGKLTASEAGKPIASNDVTATVLEWLPLAKEAPLLCVGFSHGGVSIFTPCGAVCLSFCLVAKAVLRVRWSEAATASSSEQTGSDFSRVLLLHDGGHLAVVAASSLRVAIYGASTADSEDFHFQLYEIKGRHATTDACLVDELLPLEDVFDTRVSAGVVATGKDPFLSSHRLPEIVNPQRSLIGAAASTLGSVARSLVPFRSAATGFNPLKMPSSNSAGTLRIRDIQVPAGTKPEELALAAKFIDPTRQGDVLCIAPGVGQKASLGLLCDGFARVALVCLETLRCLHLWKGYRDAQAAWLQCPVGAASVKPSAACIVESFAVIYAPLRRLLEVWDVGAVAGPKRVAAEVLEGDAKLLACRGFVYLLRRNGQIDAVDWTPVLEAEKNADGTQEHAEADGGA
eukprot:TRINITY_DN67594_c0_g1_i1.p1 TRINITY_DN67594_c0_g1~~TRINITY_DN67594_c0_g1_i1.p1  ORF type:complete len:452 (-),score=79.09 TRINITY_DN67594_c0_g1_i1:500-1855(-)